MLLGYRLNEPGVFEPVGYQFGGIWMDVRYQDGDWWDLTIFHGTEHKCSHNVNPWAGELRHRYNQDHIDYRIKRVLELWPQQARRIEHYLLPWRTPVTRSGKQRFVPRRGKAYETDEYEYGDAYQLHDFIRAFGIDRTSRSVVVRYPCNGRRKARNRRRRDAE